MAQINVRVDDEVKANAEKVLKQLGLPMSVAVNIYLTKIGREHRIPFELSLEPNAETREAINEVQRMKADPTLGTTDEDVDKMMEDLLA